MTIRLAKRNEAESIANIHQNEIKKGFLSSLRTPFLTNLYRAIIESEFSFSVVAEEKNEIIGFIAGTFDLDKFYSYFLKRYFFQAILTILPQIFNFQKLKGIFETLLYSTKGKELPKAELLTIAVKKKFQGKDIASQMFEKFVLEMKERGVDTFKVVVGKELSPAIKFYEREGFQFLKEIEIHGREPSLIYLYKIK